MTKKSPPCADYLFVTILISIRNIVKTLNGGENYCVHLIYDYFK